MQWMQDELDRLKGEGQYRILTESVPSCEEGWVWRNGRRMLNLASNHYLGLGHRLDEAVLARWSAYADESVPGPGAGTNAGIRTGATASRLIVGGDPAIGRFEREFAAYKGTEACLVFGSGYMANVGIIGALVGRNDIVFSDKLNHASIVDGAVLSRAETVRYRNRDMNHLESLLRRAEPSKKKLIVTDSVFSMDGSLAPLSELVELKERYGAMLMVDEAHSGGVYGREGEGLAHALGLTGKVDVHMGTFSKAYGCYGAYAAGNKVVIDYLVNKARSLIFSTALPPMVVHAIRDQWGAVRRDGWRRERLLSQAEWLRTQLRSAGFDTGDSECHIVPVIVGGNERALAFGRRLQEEGVAAVPIRPPTVPEGSARIRFTPMATHRDDELRMALARIVSVGRELGVV
ncbi:aminotransferase class I/II-fold pyridoxal phosphate-dependent enzyme [Paenibacillus mesophilus]|uniref:aminotransferase class I/II-fold pyridoxal phosphate-dependent enzyme n=1 Tax=Paenibacillus mesophilus TaxID=2582849 RepID=UPI001EE4C560|nr:8-amino-7-oxononanoate synthase [Paenibacillus mesophilus]